MGLSTIWHSETYKSRRNRLQNMAFQDSKRAVSCDKTHRFAAPNGPHNRTGMIL